MADRSVNIRLSLKDGELVKRGLQSLGDEGQAALKRLEAGGEPASRALRAVNTAAVEGKAAIHSWADEAGAAGRVLAAFGPAGIVAAAGVGAFVLAGGKIIEMARAAANELDTLQDNAARLGVGTEFLQGLRFSAEQMGASAEKVDGAIDVLNRKMGEIAEGGGKKAKEAFDRLGVSIFDAQGHLRNAQQVLPDMADGFQKMGSAAEYASTASELFGKGNTEFARTLSEGAAGLQAQIDKAREMGAVLDEELVRKGSDAKDQLEALSSVIRTQMNGALVQALPLLTAMATGLAHVAAWAGRVVDGFRAINQQQLGTLQGELESINGRIAQAQVNLAQPGGPLGGIPIVGAIAGMGVSLENQRQLNDLLEERAQITARIAAIQREAQPDRGTGGAFDAAAGPVLEATTATKAHTASVREHTTALHEDRAAEEARRKAMEEGKKAIEAEQKAEEARIKEIHGAAKESFQSLFSTLNSNLIEGQNFWDAFANAGITALDRLEAKLLDIVTNRLFEELLGDLFKFTPTGAFTGLGPQVLPGAPPVGTQSPVGVGASVTAVHVTNNLGSEAAVDVGPTGPTGNVELTIRRITRDELADRRGQKVMRQVYDSRTPVMRRR
jgi:hypothetical protein